ncbi:MAG: hypothetical protein K0Q49_1822 [Haloplasmataceae bacterium]|jgi:hypothetical protein|nr:hypothetical protein [Haloplasmataceae bacterium]
MEPNIVVKVYEPSDYEKVLSFLQSVHSLNEIEDDLFENAILILKDEIVVGMITFELFRNKALIRYFIFDKDVDQKYLYEMYQKYFDSLRSKDIKRVFVIINNDGIKEMFANLGFIEFPKEDFFLTEESILNSKYKDATVLIYELEH